MALMFRHTPEAMVAHPHIPSHSHSLPTAYPVPARRSNRNANTTGSGGLSYTEHELLRSRKTPSGRLDEYLEVTCVDESESMPAAKHLLLSLSPNRDRRPSWSLNSPRNVQDQIHGSRSATGHFSWSPNFDILRPLSESPAYTNVTIHQTPLRKEQQLDINAGSHVPTALPTTLNIDWGPTASAAQQFFGPYWPDGTFSPYCPAPIRDSHFLNVNLDPRTVVCDNGREFRTLRRSGKLPILKHFGVPYFKHETLSSDREEKHYLSFSSRSLGTKAGDKSAHDHEGWHNVRDSVDIVSPFPNKTLGLCSPSNLMRPSEATDTIILRDRSFSWAYNAYVDLLAEIQRENQPGRLLGGFTKTNNKPTIYPKPPRRARTYANHDADTLREVGAMLDSAGNESQAHIMVYSDPSPGLETEKFATSSHWSKAGQDESPHTVYQDPRRVSEPFLHRSRVDTPQSSPSLAAASALASLENLCGQAQTPWADGMLLAGCLAYGLGNYEKALMWYQAIVTQNPHHVEAVSNLAATLLALGRRDEALQHWSAAVMLRPSYFEALEHLIGLLCTAHRAKDAIQMIDYVQKSLKLVDRYEPSTCDSTSDCESDTRSQDSSATTGPCNDNGIYDYDVQRRVSTGSFSTPKRVIGFGSSGYAIPGSENGRLLALIHAKGNMLYSLGENVAAAASFEDAISVATGHQQGGIRGLIEHILQSCVSHVHHFPTSAVDSNSKEPILLAPDRAQITAQRMFPPTGELPGLQFVPRGLAHKAAISTTSNSLLSLAKIYQDGLGAATFRPDNRANGTREILALYYLSLSLQRSPSTANNVGILLANVQHSTNVQVVPQCTNNQIVNYTGISPGSGVALALQYYNYGLNIDPHHAHLYTNLGSLLKDLGQLNSAIKMYEIAVQCDGNFDIALANLANAVKDQGRIVEAITYYRRAVQANPDFAEAVCGLATALNSVCNWYGRGGVYADQALRDAIHVDEKGKIQRACTGCGWINRVVEIVDRQLKDGENWGIGTLDSDTIEHICGQLSLARSHLSGQEQEQFKRNLRISLQQWSGKRWEGARVVQLIERAIKQIGWQWYHDRYRRGKNYASGKYSRPVLPSSLSSPTTPTVLPFHTFTTPLSAKQVRQISQRNAIRISVTTLRAPWLPTTVFPPPPPPQPYLKVGYVSSDFNNHPLAHLMQSIFGMHSVLRVQAICYATTPSDGSIHRQKIEREAPIFRDTSAWSTEKLVSRIVNDGVHILVNLNGYTRGAKNEVFAARAAPIQMSFMGFAGTLGAEWCDYVFADSISILPETLSPWRRNVDVEDRLHPDALAEDTEDWIYAENVIFAKSTFFCVDHKQSAPDAQSGLAALSKVTDRDALWQTEQDRRWRLRKELFPSLSDTAVIFGNFNQLYKIDPATFRTYLRILAAVPNAILWLLRFPDVGEQNLKNFAREWAGEEVTSRIVFTDVAPKGAHIVRASVVDLFLDTPECNAHTTAADVIWSGTPILTWAKWKYKMCSRMATSIVASALPEGPLGDDFRADLLVESEEEYENHAIFLATDLCYPRSAPSVGRGVGRLMDLRRTLWETRWTSRLFDTKRWVNDLEDAYWKAWRKWERGEGGDIWL